MASSRLRRTILMEWDPKVSKEEIEKILEETREHLAKIEGVRDVVLGRIKKGLYAENRNFTELKGYNYGMSLDFDDEAAYQRYSQNQRHAEMHEKYQDLVIREQVTDIRDD